MFVWKDRSNRFLKRANRSAEAREALERETPGSHRGATAKENFAVVIKFNQLKTPKITVVLSVVVYFASSVFVWKKPPNRRVNATR